MTKKMIYLDRNESNYGPAPACFEVLRNADLTKLSWYTKAHTRGVKSDLSERIANDLGVNESQVILGYGAEDILKQAVQCYLHNGSKLMVPSYSWWYYKRIAEEVDGVNCEYPLVKGDDTFYYDIEGMLEIYKKEKPDMVFISSPNNPTGNMMDLKDLKYVLGELKDVYVVLDEAYANTTEQNYVNELLAINPNLIIARTFSKYFALAGIRIGYAIIGDNLTGMRKFTNRYLGYHRLSEEIALAALDSQDYYKDIARKMSEDKEMFYKELGELEGFTVYKSFANFVLVEIPEEIKDGLKEFLLSRNISIKFMNEEILNHHLRITLGTQEQNRLLVDSIKEFMNK